MSASRPAPDHRSVPTRSVRALVLAAGIGLGLGQTASAQFAFEDAILPPRVVAWRLAERGFTGLTRPRFDGRVYVVEAVDPAGAPIRLFVDPAAGAIVGRQRLGAPETYARLERPAPGFGWTEEEAGPRRALRPLPPDGVTDPAPRPLRRHGAAAVRPDRDPATSNPDGLNPDAAVRTEPRRKVARAVPPSQQPDLKPSLRTTPEAPAPRVAPSEAARPAAKPEAPAAATEPPPAAGARTPDDRNSPAVRDGARTDGARAETAKAAPDWKDPPAEGRRPVRVIGGATVVPGTAEAREPGKDAGP